MAHTHERAGVRVARQAVGLTDGLCAADGGSAINKTDRERHFPAALLAPAMALTLQRGNASVESGPKFASLANKVENRCIFAAKRSKKIHPWY